jgi:hypothetical protein
MLPDVHDLCQDYLDRQYALKDRDLVDSFLIAADSDLMFGSDENRLTQDGAFYLGKLTVVAPRAYTHDEIIDELWRTIRLNAYGIPGAVLALDVYTEDDGTAYIPVHAIYLAENPGYLPEAIVDAISDALENEVESSVVLPCAV